MPGLGGRMVFRNGFLAILALIVARGCHTAGFQRRYQFEPPPEVAQPRVSPVDVIDRINQNARLVHSLKASPSIKVTMGRRSTPVSGKLALERPRNFKLVMTSLGQDVA